MGQIWEFFENLNEYVYVSDIETYELIYMNRRMREFYGFRSTQELAGKQCHEVLHGCFAPCALCNNRNLEEGSFLEWDFYNPAMDKLLLVKDTLRKEEGRSLRVELAIDAGQGNYQARGYQNLEARINEGMRVALRAPTPDQSLETVLEYLGKALNGERTYIFERNENGRDDNTYEWVQAGVKPEKENLQNLPPEICANWYRNFHENRHIVIRDLEEIRESDPLQYENLKRQEIRSLVVVPLYDDREVIGFYGVDNPPRRSLDYAANMLQIMGHFIVSSLRRRNLVRQLRRMSCTDPLTRLGNRYAMSEYMEERRSGEALGVVYCDVTGLKQVNDTQGHEAGDQLILRACSCLRSVLGEYGLFRIGGDELLALCGGIGEEEMERRVSLLKERMKEYDVVIAVGAVWQENGGCCIDELLRESESRMYEDKSAYYRTSGRDRRR